MRRGAFCVQKRCHALCSLSCKNGITGPNWPGNANRSDGTECNQSVYLLLLTSQIKKIDKVLAERDRFAPTTKEPVRRAGRLMMRQRGCSSDFQTDSIATDSNCRSNSKAMRTAEINDFGGTTKSTLHCRNSDQSTFGWAALWQVASYFLPCKRANLLGSTWVSLRRNSQCRCSD